MEEINVICKSWEFQTIEQIVSQADYIIEYWILVFGKKPSTEKKYLLIVLSTHA